MLYCPIIILLNLVINYIEILQETYIYILLLLCLHYNFITVKSLKQPEDRLNRYLPES